MLSKGELKDGATVLEIDYAQQLEADPAVASWQHRLIPIVYYDHCTGEELVYYISFYVEYVDDTTAWIEAIPQRELRPIDKYLYAITIAKSSKTTFRGLYEKELNVRK